MTIRFDKTVSATTVAQVLAKEIRGKTIVITDVTTGTLGGESAMSLSLHDPAQLIMLGRTESKAQFVENETKKLSAGTKISFVNCDLEDQESVRAAAQHVLSLTNNIDLLICNAETMAVPYSTTRQGIESQFGMNHIGHFLLANLLLPKFSSGSRIVNVTSGGYEMSDFNFTDYSFSGGSTYQPWKAYAQSKTANILFTTELAKRLAGRNIAAFAVHPGFVPDSNLAAGAKGSELSAGQQLWKETHNGEDDKDSRHPKTLQQGAAGMIVAGFDPSFANKSGGFVKDCQIAPTLPFATDPTAAARLWALSEELVGEKFSF